MDPLLILVAFIFGFAVYRVGLPPLVGYLIAGSALQALGEETEGRRRMTDDRGQMTED